MITAQATVDCLGENDPYGVNSFGEKLGKVDSDKTVDIPTDASKSDFFIILVLSFKAVQVIFNNNKRLIYFYRF